MTRMLNVAALMLLLSSCPCFAEGSDAGNAKHAVNRKPRIEISASPNSINDTHRVKKRVTSFSSIFGAPRFTLSYLDLRNPTKYCPENEIPPNDVKRPDFKGENRACIVHNNISVSDVLTENKRNTIKNVILPSVASAIAARAFVMRKRGSWMLPNFTKTSICAFAAVWKARNASPIDNTDVLIYVVAGPMSGGEGVTPTVVVEHCAASKGYPMVLGMHFNPRTVLSGQEIQNDTLKALLNAMGASNCGGDMVLLLNPPLAQYEEKNNTCLSVRCGEGKQGTTVVEYKHNGRWKNCEDLLKEDSFALPLGMKCPTAGDVCPSWRRARDNSNPETDDVLKTQANLDTSDNGNENDQSHSRTEDTITHVSVGREETPKAVQTTHKEENKVDEMTVAKESNESQTSMTDETHVSVSTMDNRTHETSNKDKGAENSATEHVHAEVDQKDAHTETVSEESSQKVPEASSSNSVAHTDVSENKENSQLTSGSQVEENQSSLSHHTSEEAKSTISVNSVESCDSSGHKDCGKKSTASTDESVSQKKEKEEEETKEEETKEEEVKEEETKEEAPKMDNTEVEDIPCSTAGTVCVRSEENDELTTLSKNLGAPRITFSTVDLEREMKHCPFELDRFHRLRPNFKGSQQYCFGYDSDFSDTLTDKKKQQILSQIIPNVNETLIHRSLIHRLTERAAVPQFGPGSICSNFSIPNEHYTGALNQTDIVFYIAAGPMLSDEYSIPVWAERCETEEGQPIAIAMNFNPRKIVTTTNIFQFTMKAISNALGVSICDEGKSLLLRRRPAVKLPTAAQESCIHVKCENGRREQLQLQRETEWKECARSNSVENRTRQGDAEWNACQSVGDVCRTSHIHAVNIPLSKSLKTLRIKTSALDLHNVDQFCLENSHIDKYIRPAWSGVYTRCFRHKDPNKSDALTKEKIHLLQSKILPELIASLESSPLLHRRRTALKIPKFERNSMCSRFIVPKEHRNDGLKDTDVVLYVAAAPVPLYDQHLFVSAVPCAFINGRAVAVAVNFDPAAIIDNANISQMALYEVSKALNTANCPKESAVILHAKGNETSRQTTACVSLKCEEESEWFLRFNDKETWKKCVEGEEMESTNHSVTLKCPKYSHVCSVPSDTLSTEGNAYHSEEDDVIMNTNDTSTEGIRLKENVKRLFRHGEDVKPRIQKTVNDANKLGKGEKNTVPSSKDHASPTSHTSTEHNANESANPVLVPYTGPRVGGIRKEEKWGHARLAPEGIHVDSCKRGWVFLPITMIAFILALCTAS